MKSSMDSCIDDLNIVEKRKMFSGGGRDFSIDILRCFSCYMVIVGHVSHILATNSRVELVAWGSVTWFALTLIHYFFIAATSIFVMVSGIFFLSPERPVTPKKIWSKNILKLAMAYIVWQFLYTLFRVLYLEPQPISMHVILKGMLGVDFHLWYIPMMIGLYVMAPLLRIITANAEIIHYRYMIIIFVGAIALNTIYGFNLSGPFQYSDEINLIITRAPVEEMCQYCWYFILGYYLYTYRAAKKTRLIVYLLGACGLIAGIFASMYLGFITGDINGKFTLFTFGKNISIFILFITLFSEIKLSQKAKKVLSKLSSATLFIYLFHWMLMEFYFKEEWLCDTGINPVLIVLIYSLSIYIIGFIVSLCIQAVSWIRIRDAILDVIWPNRTIYKAHN